MSTNLNTTINGTQSSNCSNPEAEKIGYTFAYSFIFVVSLTGNFFLGITVYKTKTMRKPINFLIANMAMSDLLYPICLFPKIITEFYVDSWLISGPIGQALCKLVIFLPEVSNAVSIQSLVLIAVDRFGAVVFPLRSPFISSKLCPFFILTTWIVAMAIFSPFLIAVKLIVEYPGRLVCVLRWNEGIGNFSSFQSYVVANFIILYYVPLLLIAVLYIAILFKLKSQKAPGQQSVNAEQQRARRERNVLKMSFAIVFMFAVCWLTFTSVYLRAALLAEDFPIMRSCGFKHLWSFAFFLARSNCAINPCICFIFSGNYRQGLKTLLNCSVSVHQRSNQVAPH